MLKMIVAMGAASVMTTVVMANTAAMAMFGAQAVFGSTTRTVKPEDKTDVENSPAKGSDSK